MLYAEENRAIFVLAVVFLLIPLSEWIRQYRKKYLAEAPGTFDLIHLKIKTKVVVGEVETAAPTRDFLLKA